MKMFSKLALSLVLLFSLASSAFAAEKNADDQQVPQQGLIEKMTDKDYQKMKIELKKRDVKEDVADKLVEKMKNGNLPDSVTKELKDAKEVKKVKDGDKEETIYTYEDGSLTVTGAEGGTFTPADKKDSSTTGSITTFGTGLEGGTYTSGSGYGAWKHRTVYYENVGVWKISFQADYTLLQGGYDKITWAGNESTWLVYGTIGSPSCRIIRANEAYTVKAEARYSAYLYIGGSYGTLTRSISLLVSNDSAVPQGNTYY